MYLSRTRIGEKQLNELMDRDLMLSAARCLELGVCDRVLSLDAPSSSAARPRLASAGMGTGMSTGMSTGLLVLSACLCV